MNFLCKYLGGSHLYGLNHSGSDLDERGVYISDNVHTLLGFANDKSQVSNSPDHDHSYFEIQRYLQLLRKTNTNSIECLFAPAEAFTILTDKFKTLRSYAVQLCDTSRLLASFKGYMYGESRLALGERTGRLGGKRKQALDSLGFSPKNVSHMVRLSYCARTLFDTGQYPVRITGTPVYDLCYDLKTTPEKFTIGEVKDICAQQLAQVDELEDTLQWTFNTSVAVEILVDAYYDQMTEVHKQYSKY